LSFLIRSALRDLTTDTVQQTRIVTGSVGIAAQAKMQRR
jgi:hypothetical protein